MGQLRAALDTLLAADLSRLGGAEVLEVLEAVEAQRRRLAAVDQVLLAEVEQRGLAGEHGCPSGERLLRQVLRVGCGEGAARINAARLLGPRRELSGAVLAPQFAATAAAQVGGQISPAHAAVITAAITALPGPVRAERDGEIEQFLLTQALLFDPPTLAKLARRLGDTLDPDGGEPVEAYRARTRGLALYPRADGSARLHGELDAACAEALRTVWDATTRPAAAIDGVADARTAAQRRHDGLLDALLLTLRAGELPQTNGVSTTIILTLTEAQLRAHTAGQPAGLVTTGHGSQFSVSQALRLATDARLIPVVFGTAKQVSAYGTSHRIFTEGQRLAMIARDQGCSFPGCDTPPLWCQAHHLTDHALTGHTSIDDGTLLCGYHHREHHRLGWRARMTNGTPHWIPPAWIDPHQKPRRNHHPTPALS